MYSEKQLEAAFNAGCAYTVGSHKDLKQIHPNFQEWKAKLKRMRTINELLIILRDNARVKKSWFGLRQRIESGLCYEVGKLEELGILSIDEWSILRQHIHINAPDYIKDSGYRWTPYKWKPRLKWLNKQIELTKEV